jgi:hypothetical protein
LFFSPLSFSQREQQIYIPGKADASFLRIQKVAGRVSKSSKTKQPFIYGLFRRGEKKGGRVGRRAIRAA